ncbi:MAG: hypothetical protein ACFFG0_14285 [Candidatus Thorarchaeota archaeon]
MFEDAAKSIIETFLTKYNEILKNFNRQISNFKSFGKIVVNIILAKLTNFKEAVFIEQKG